LYLRTGKSKLNGTRVEMQDLAARLKGAFAHEAPPTTTEVVGLLAGWEVGIRPKDGISVFKHSATYMTTGDVIQGFPGELDSTRHIAIAATWKSEEPEGVA
jgi:hypothetical protein